MLSRLLGAIGRPIRGAAAAVWRRPAVFAGTALGVFVLQVLIPVLFLSLVRKPVDFYTFNPWLSQLPAYLASDEIPLEKKLEFLPKLALFWCSADGPGGPEWGFAVDVTDLARILVMSLLVGTYFALWVYRRERAAACGWGARASQKGGLAGALGGVLGLSTAPCSVMGCGAPVIPVVGLAFAGLSSGTLALMATLSRLATALVLIALTLAVAVLGWRAGAAAPQPGASPSA